jgi:ferredoxin
MGLARGQERRLRVGVDRAVCMGNGQCVALAPGVFRHNEDLQSEVVDPAGAPEELILKAAAYCPTGAITVEDARTGETLFP